MKISIFLLWYFVLTNVVYIVVIFWRFLKIWLLTENCYLATLLRCQLSRRRAMMGFQKQSQQSRKHRTFFQELMIVPAPPPPPIFSIPELINCWRSILTLLIILIYIFWSSINPTTLGKMKKSTKKQISKDYMKFSPQVPKTIF